MTHTKTNRLASSTKQTQQQKPAREPSKASQSKNEVPKGHIVRTGHRIALRPIREVGPRDSDTLQMAVRDFGFLIPMGGLVVETLAGFAARIENYCGLNKRARHVADALHRLSA